MAILSLMTISIITVVGLIFLSCWLEILSLFLHLELIPIQNCIVAHSFILFPVDAGKRSTLNFPIGLPFSQNSKYCKKETTGGKNKTKPTLLLSSFIADNFIRCQENKTKKNLDTKQQLYRNFLTEEMTQ